MMSSNELGNDVGFKEKRQNNVYWLSIPGFVVKMRSVGVAAPGW